MIFTKYNLILYYFYLYELQYVYKKNTPIYFTWPNLIQKYKIHFELYSWQGFIFAFYEFKC